MLIRNKILSSHINFKQIISEKKDLFHKREIVSPNCKIFCPDFNPQKIKDKDHSLNKKKLSHITERSVTVSITDKPKANDLN